MFRPIFSTFCYPYWKCHSFISAELGEKLYTYIHDTWPDGIVKLRRTKERNGLIRARIAGGEGARGDVLIFLDSHCEANVGW